MKNPTRFGAITGDPCFTAIGTVDTLIDIVGVITAGIIIIR